MVIALEVTCYRCGRVVLVWPENYNHARDALVAHYKLDHPRRWQARHRRADW